MGEYTANLIDWSQRQRAVPVKGHAFRPEHVDRHWHKVWRCSCGEEYGRQPEMSQAKGHAAHRAHLDAMREGAT